MTQQIHNITVSDDTLQVLNTLKEKFKNISLDDELSYDDIITILAQSFLESLDWEDSK